MGAHLPMPSERLARGRRRGLGADRPEGFRWPRGAAFRRGRRSRHSPPVGAVSAGVSTASRPWSEVCGNGSPNGSRGTARSSCSRAWTIGCSPTSACAAPTSSSRSTAGWPIRGYGARRRWRSYCSRAGAGRCRTPRPTAISRSRHDPFPTWPPDSRRTGWILSVRRRHWLSGGAGRSASRPGRRSRRRPRCCQA